MRPAFTSAGLGRGRSAVPLAAESAPRRVDARVGTIDTVVEADEQFDTILLLGNNSASWAAKRRATISGSSCLKTQRGNPCPDLRSEGASELAALRTRNRDRGKMVAWNACASGIGGTPRKVLFASRDGPFVSGERRTK